MQKYRYSLTIYMSEVDSIIAKPLLTDLLNHLMVNGIRYELFIENKETKQVLVNPPINMTSDTR